MKNPADPFIDRKGYLDLIDQDERRFREQLKLATALETLTGAGLVAIHAAPGGGGKF